MKTISLGLLIALILPMAIVPISADAWGWYGGGGCGHSCGTNSVSVSSYQEVIVYPSTYPAHSNASYGYGGGGGCNGCGGGYSAFQTYPMTVGSVDWGDCWGCTYDPQWVFDPWTESWY